jgi:hypothetical protein
MQVVDSLRSKPTEKYTPHEVGALWKSMGVSYDADIVSKNNLDGMELLRLNTIGLIRSRLGVRPFGHACFALNAIRQSTANKVPLACILPINSLPVEEGNVVTWTVVNVCSWLSRHKLNVLEPVFKMHLINGAALLLMDVSEFANLDELVLKHERELRTALATLPTRVDD